MRSILASLLLYSSFAMAADFARSTYAEIQVGLATSTGLDTFQDIESERVAPGSLGTTLMFSGYFPVFKSLTLSPTFALLTTDGKVSRDPTAPTVFDVRFHQREFGVDALFSPAKMGRLNIGVGSSMAWWTASEDNARQTETDVFVEGRSIEGKSLMARGVAHWALRNPEVSGASLKLVAAWPLTELLRLDNTAATGYVGLQCGFSMILN